MDTVTTPNIPRARRDRRHLVGAERQRERQSNPRQRSEQRRRGRRRRRGHHRLRHLARESQLQRPRRDRASWCFQQLPGWHGKCVPGEAFNASDCNQKLIARPVLCRGLWRRGRHQGAVPVRVHLRARGRRPRRAHGQHGRGNYGVAASVRRHGARLDQRHGAARAHRGLQDLLGQLAGRGLPEHRQRGRDRPGRRRRRGRDQLLDLGHEHELPRPGGDRVPFAADAGVFVAASAGNSGPTASTVAHPEPVDHHRGCRARTTGTGKAR